MAAGTQVTAAEIARLAGVGRAAVSNWRRRFADFPEPTGGTAASPTFDVDSVERWLEKNGRVRRLPPEEQAWQAMDGLRGERQLPDVLVLVGEHLLGDGRGSGGASGSVDRLLRAVDELAGTTGAAGTYQYLVERYLGVDPRRVPTTPPGLAELMAGFAEAPRTVFDPACGTGTLLLEAARHAGDRAVARGADLSVQHARIAELRLRLAGVEAEIDVRDSLRHDRREAAEADLVVCHPPFGVREWGHEELAHDPRWRYGLPPRGESELAWVQHSLAHTAPDGVVAILVPPSVAARRSGRRIRGELVRRGALRAVITLPAAAVALISLPLQLWVLARPGGDYDPQAHLLFVDLSDRDGRAMDTAAWRDLAGEVHELWRHLRASGRAAAGGLRHDQVPLIRVLDDEIDLTPARWLPAPATALSVAELPEIGRRLRRALASLPDLMPDVETVDRREIEFATVHELLRTKALHLHLGRHRRDAEDGDAAPMVTLDDVRTGGPPSGRATPDGQHAVRVRPGDVVVPTTGRELPVRVIGDEDALLGPYLCLLRCDPDVYDPWFVAGFLRRPANLHLAASSSQHRLDVRRAELPRPIPLAAQRRYAEMFRRLADFEHHLADASALARELGNIVLEGVAAGDLQPVHVNSGEERGER